MSDAPEWFAPKRYGYGSGLPISWQGWALLLGFIVGVPLLAILLARSHPIVVFAVLIPIALAFCLICARTTRGGWRWRWGDDD
jgi:hypothetical protein